MYEAAWFFGGILIFILLSRMLRHYQMVGFINVVLTQCLKLIGTISDDVAHAKTIKYQALEEAKIPEELIQKIKSTDEKSFHNWKVSTITLFLLTFPKKYAGMLRFYDWDGAMKVLDDIYVEEKKYRTKNG
jgi:hypothetical protein